MTALSPTKTGLITVNLDDYTLPPLPKDTRGYLYIVEDSVYPDWVKVGRTIDPKKRLQQYNSDKPFPTARMTCISSMLDDVVAAEKIVLDTAYGQFNPSTASREWFRIENKGKLISIVDRTANLQLDLKDS